MNAIELHVFETQCSRNGGLVVFACGSRMLDFEMSKQCTQKQPVGLWDQKYARGKIRVTPREVDQCHTPP